jgi:Flp pilus assembly protein TadG
MGRWRDDRGAQLVEFAVALPLLVLFVVGIFDFSNAFTFKQKLTNIARDAARVAAADPTNDLVAPTTPSAVPASVLDAFQVIDNYMLANNINDCGITPSSSPTGLTWTSTATGNGCATPGLTIIINRGYYFAATPAASPASVNCAAQPVVGGPTQTAIIGTCVSIQYAYQWRFGRIASVLGSTMSLPTSITVAAVAMNEN